MAKLCKAWQQLREQIDDEFPERAKKDVARKAIFEKLGITEEEAKLLLS